MCVVRVLDADGTHVRNNGYSAQNRLNLAFRWRTLQVDRMPCTAIRPSVVHRLLPNDFGTEIDFSNVFQQLLRPNNKMLSNLIKSDQKHVV